MKLIMENWRGFLAEGWEEEHEKQEKEASLEKGDVEKHGCLTVGTFLKILDDAQKEESDEESGQRSKGHMWNLAKRFIGVVGGPIADLVGLGGDVFDIMKATKDALRTDLDNVKMETLADFPILGLLKIDPEIISVLDNDVLKALDERYENEILRKMKATTCLDKVPSINEFIRKEIYKNTDGQVVAPRVIEK